jgi:hypothetical protein
MKQIWHLYFRLLAGIVAVFAVIGAALYNYEGKPESTLPPVVSSVAVAETSTTTSTTLPASTTTSTTEAPIVLDAAALEYLRTITIDQARQQYGRCGEWHDLALQAGWTEAEWPTLSRVLYRESRCVPDAWNGADAGLTQINRIHRQWIQDMGMTHPDSMFDPLLNLRFARMLWESSGWRPWRYIQE